MLLALGFANIAIAQATKGDPKTAAPSIAEILQASGVTATGYLDGTYWYESAASAGTTAHDSNAFAVNQASLSLGYMPPTGFGVLINPIVGTEACDGCYAPGYGSSGAHAGTSGINLLQAYAQYVTRHVTIMGGKFVTLAGAEGAAPTANTNVTRSLIWWYSEPTTHVGVRMAYAASDKATMTIGVNNGWNNDGSTPSGGKTAEFGINLNPTKTLSLAAVSYFGAFDLGGGLVGNRTLLDVVGTWNATSEVTIVVNADWDQQDHPRAPGSGSAVWYGLAAYVNLSINDRWRTSLRIEQMDDRDGYLFGRSTKVNEGTLTAAYSPARNFELRSEARQDAYRPERGGRNTVTQGWLQALFKL